MSGPESTRHEQEKQIMRSFHALAVLGTVLMMSVASLATAQSIQGFEFTNNSGAPASDLHAVFSGTGGTVTAWVLTQPAGCPAPTIPTNTPPLGNSFTIDWGVACVPVGATVEVEVRTDFGPAVFVSGEWTFPPVAIPPGDVVEGVMLPMCCENSGLPGGGAWDKNNSTALNGCDNHLGPGSCFDAHTGRQVFKFHQICLAPDTGVQCVDKDPPEVPVIEIEDGPPMIPTLSPTGLISMGLLLSLAMTVGVMRQRSKKLTGEGTDA